MLTFNSIIVPLVRQLIPACRGLPFQHQLYITCEHWFLPTTSSTGRKVFPVVTCQVYVHVFVCFSLYFPTFPIAVVSPDVPPCLAPLSARQSCRSMASSDLNTTLKLHPGPVDMHYLGLRAAVMA